MQGLLGRASAFLVAAHNPDGGWAYWPISAQSAPEPSCHCLLALNDSETPRRKGVSWLESRIGSDGGMRYEGDEDIHWCTSLAAFTLARIAASSTKLEACTRCLLSMRGSANKAVGWAWTDQTYSWVEPTSYAILALKAAGQGRHRRVTQGEHMLGAQTCPGGGWNQGLVNSFYPDPQALPTQTALGILALQDQAQWRSQIDKAVSFLRSEVSTHPTVLSLTWTILALDAIGENTGNFPAELERRQEPDGSWRGSVHLTALAVLALQAAKEGRNAFRL